MRFFRDLIEQSLNRTREATLGVLGVNDSGLRRHLSEKMVDELGADGCFLAPPVFEHTFGWKESKERLQDLEGSLLSKSLLNTLQNAHAYVFPRDAHPYTHQLHAWRTLLSEEPRSAIITSGTGSGKTECFMVPILEDLIRERDLKQTPLVGVRALFLYPLNALINSQQERLDAWTREYGKDIRFCLYNGKTEEREGVVRKIQVLKQNQILSRELLRKEPAPILMTNATMLEYMLVRQVDNPILEISKQQQSLRWIVLDEAHTYVGSQAAEMSLLLRRVVQAFGKTPEQIRFVATSATIADVDAENKLKRYLADLAGVRLEQVEVIGGSRVWPDILFNSQEQNIPLEEVQSIEPQHEVSSTRFDALGQSSTARSLRHAIVNSAKPLDLDDLLVALESKLKPGNRLKQQQEVLGWLDVLTGTRLEKNGPPFLKLRAHLFQRMLHGLWSCVDVNCSAKSKHLKDWPFGNVYVNQRAVCECKAPVYELGFCDDCKTPHLIAEDRNGVLHQLSPYAGDEFSLSYENGEEEASSGGEVSGPSNRTPVQRLVIAGLQVAQDPFLTVSLDLDTHGMCATNAKRPINIVIAEDKEACCSHCDHYLPNNKSFLRKAYLGAPFYVANAVPTVLEFCPDAEKDDSNGRSPEELPGRGRKLITFTDSRQGTARMAVRMQQEAERSRLRGLVFETLRNAQAKADAEPKDVPTGDFTELMVQAEGLEKLGMGVMAAELRRQANALRSGGSPQKRVASVDWGDMVQELAASKDVEQSILRYNRYANPVLFDGSQGGATMARLLLAREFARRPKNQNSTETLGLVKVTYRGLKEITSTPPMWTATRGVPATGPFSASGTSLTLEDWHDFLKVALDFYVRENTFINMDRDMQSWMGSRFTPKSLFSPKNEMEESTTIKKWPQIKSGNPHRLVKLLEQATGLNRTINTDADKINAWLEAAWAALTHTHILESADPGHRLKLETLSFSLLEEGWVCPITHRIFDSTFRGLTPYLPMKLRPQDYRCHKIQLASLAALQIDGSPVAKQLQIREQVLQDPVIQHLRSENLWTDISDRTVEGGFYYRTAEHSAQQSAQRLDDYVELFKKGDVNVLNCSTTMEMGVDIGGISAVVMNNLPPHPANYLQRAGRAGRRGEARAIAYTLCKADPHNQRAFAQPKWPFVTVIPAPTITLSSSRIVQRHVNSLLLSIFLKSKTSSDGDRTRLTLQWFFGGDDSPCQQFKSWLASCPEEFSDPIKRLVSGTCLDGRLISSIATETQEGVRNLEERWLEESRKLHSKLQAATDQPYRKALELEKKRHEGEYLLRDLAARAFLPGYGFPTDVVTLNTYNIEDFKHQRNHPESREDSIFNNKELPSRGLNIAIREYAPGSQVVIDGRVYRSAGVSLQWHASGQVNEAQKFDIAWRCSNCGATGVIENAYTNSSELTCSHCAHAIQPSERRMVLRPGGFVTDFYEATTNDITSQKFIRVERPRIQLTGETISLPDKRCGFVRFGHEGSVFHHSSGENEKGYAVCLTCGRADSMLASGDIPKNLLPDQFHRPVGGITGSRKDFDCPGSAVKPNLFLGYQIRTDVMELYLRSPQTGMWLGDSIAEQTIATTLAVAIREVIAELLGIASTEMGFGFRLDRDLESGQGRTVIQLFDEVSGGAGFVLAGLGDTTELLRKTLGKLHCPVNCENVCSHCLAGQDSRVEREELDRERATAWLTESGLIEHLNLPKEFGDVPGSSYCSTGPIRYLSSAINSADRNDNSTSLLLIMRGDVEDWDLDHPYFREKILTWAIADKLNVKLAISSGTALSKEQKNTLFDLANLGIELEELDESSSRKKPYLVAQIQSRMGTKSLFSSDLSAATPGAAWLNTNDGIVWASSNHMPPCFGESIETQRWQQREQDARVIEITSELDGPINSLNKRLTTLIEEHAPELADLIATDQASVVSYSDRYLKSPWSLMLLSGFLAFFRNEKLESLRIQTLAPSGDQFSSQISHDWMHANDQEALLKLWLGSQFSISPEIQIKDRNKDIQHGRVITVDWVSGKRCKIFLDQGMGYWRGKMPYRDQMSFNFRADHENQALQMLEKYKSAQMHPGGDWPTYMSVVVS
ncbi:DEAD/DEAH box helicase domain-containing protein [Pseudomonas sp. IT-P44]|uniref:DEAD/DEAH box helicase n=1 Tax=unclassified Pseudomonas TaxID=196821 RepID=UPI0039E0D4DE